ncbi:hypothetical protein ACQY0O_005301 [Thecaphora frezii]
MVSRSSTKRPLAVSGSDSASSRRLLVAVLVAFTLSSYGADARPIIFPRQYGSGGAAAPPGFLSSAQPQLSNSDIYKVGIPPPAPAPDSTQTLAQTPPDWTSPDDTVQQLASMALSQIDALKSSAAADGANESQVAASSDPPAAPAADDSSSYGDPGAEADFYQKTIVAMNDAGSDPAAVAPVDANNAWASQYPATGDAAWSSAEYAGNPDQGSQYQQMVSGQRAEFAYAAAAYGSDYSYAAPAQKRGGLRLEARDGDASAAKPPTAPPAQDSAAPASAETAQASPDIGSAPAASAAAVKADASTATPVASDVALSTAKTDSAAVAGASSADSAAAAAAAAAITVSPSALAATPTAGFRYGDSPLAAAAGYNGKDFTLTFTLDRPLPTGSSASAYGYDSRWPQLGSNQKSGYAPSSFGQDSLRSSSFATGGYGGSRPFGSGEENAIAALFGPLSKPSGVDEASRVESTGGFGDADLTFFPGSAFSGSGADSAKSNASSSAPTSTHGSGKSQSDSSSSSGGAASPDNDKMVQSLLGMQSSLDAIENEAKGSQHHDVDPDASSLRQNSAPTEIVDMGLPGADSAATAEPGLYAVASKLSTLSGPATPGRFEVVPLASPPRMAAVEGEPFDASQWQMMTVLVPANAALPTGAAKSGDDTGSPTPTASGPPSDAPRETSSGDKGTGSPNFPEASGITPSAAPSPTPLDKSMVEDDGKVESAKPTPAPTPTPTPYTMVVPMTAVINSKTYIETFTLTLTDGAPAPAKPTPTAGSGSAKDVETDDVPPLLRPSGAKAASAKVNVAAVKDEECDEDEFVADSSSTRQHSKSTHDDEDGSGEDLLDLLDELDEEALLMADEDEMDEEPVHKSEHKSHKDEATHKSEHKSHKDEATHKDAATHKEDEDEGEGPSWWQVLLEIPSSSSPSPTSSAKASEETSGKGWLSSLMGWFGL